MGSESMTANPCKYASTLPLRKRPRDAGVIPAALNSSYTRTESSADPSADPKTRTTTDSGESPPFVTMNT